MRRQFSQRTTSSGGGARMLVDLGDVELQPAALAAALVQRGRADAALLVADLLVEREQVRRRSGRRRPRAPRRASRDLGVDLGERGVPARGRVVDLGLDGARARLGQLGDAALRGLAALHDLEDDVLQVALALGEGGDLALEVLQVLGRGDRAGVQALLVAGGALAHLVDVLLGLGLLAGGVALLGLRGDEQVAQLVVSSLVERLDLGVLGQRLAPVRELVEPGVQGLDVEQSDLVGGRGVQLGAPRGSVTAVAWAVQGSVTVRETRRRPP